MNKSITVIPARRRVGNTVNKEAKPKLRVAAYCRVSTDSDEQATSYDAQVEHYSNFIQKNVEWEFAGIFADDGISGTNTKKREEFNRMISECMEGHIDMIITKSISRFARNTLDCLRYIRQLKEKNIPVFFEKENINTMDSKGEVLLTIMASLAQQESESLSQNVKMGMQFRFQKGEVQVNHNRFMGYTKDEDGHLIIEPTEAEIVKRIYREYLQGASLKQIGDGLMKDGILTGAGKPKWRPESVKKILKNEKYIKRKYIYIFLGIWALTTILYFTLCKIASEQAMLIFNKAMSTQKVLRGSVTLETLDADIWGRVEFKNLVWLDTKGQPVIHVPQGRFKVRPLDIITGSIDTETLKYLELDNALFAVRFNNKMQLDIFEQEHAQKSIEYAEWEAERLNTTLAQETNGALPQKTWEKRANEHQMTFSGEQPTLREAKIEKNYLDEKELRAMGQLVSGYLDFAERQAQREVPMTMEDWAKHLDGILTSTGENLLAGNGSVSHLQAMEKAQTEYKKYKAKTLSSVEKDYLDSIKLLEQRGKQKN